MLSSLITSSIMVLCAVVASVFSGDVAASLSQLAAVANTSASVLNEAPAISSLAVSGNTGAPSSAFERTMQFTGVATDQNADADITNVSLVLYRDGNPLGENCSTDPNQCYRIAACPIDIGFGNALETYFSCSVSIPQAYAYGSWTAVAIATDTDGATGNGTLSVPVDAFVFDGGNTGSGGGGSTVIGGPAPTVPPTYPSTPTTPITTLPTTPLPQPSETPPAEEGIDLITLFYQRIGKEEPVTRFTEHHTEAYSAPLRIASGDTGLLVHDFSTVLHPTAETTRAVIIELSAGTSATWLTVYADALPPTQYPPFTIDGTAYNPLGNTVFRLSARKSDDTPVDTLTAAARVTIILPENLTGIDNLRLYRFNHETQSWNPVVYDTRDAHSISFNTTLLGDFALGNATPHAADSIIVTVFTSITCSISIIILLCILLGIIALMIVTIIRGNPKQPTPPAAIIPPVIPDIEILALPDPAEQPSLPSHESSRH